MFDTTLWLHVSLKCINNFFAGHFESVYQIFVFYFLYIAAIVMVDGPNVSNPRIPGVYSFSVTYELGSSDQDNSSNVTGTQTVEIVQAYRFVLLNQANEPLEGLSITRVNTVNVSSNLVVARLSVMSYFGNKTQSNYSFAELSNPPPYFQVSADHLLIRASSVVNGMIPVGTYRLALNVSLDNDQGSCPHTVVVNICVNIIPGGVHTCNSTLSGRHVCSRTIGSYHCTYFWKQCKI